MASLTTGSENDDKAALIKGVDITLRQSQLTTRQLQCAARVLSSLTMTKTTTKELKKLIIMLEQLARRRNNLLKARWAYKSTNHNQNSSSVGLLDAAAATATATATATAQRTTCQHQRDSVDGTENALNRVCSVANTYLLRINLDYPDTNNYQDVKTYRHNLSVSDAAAIATAMATTNTDAGCYNQEGIQALEQVIQGLRHCETTYDFHGQIICEATSLLAPTTEQDDSDSDDSSEEESNKNKRNTDAYSLENFAYGSTPLSTWLLLMSAIKTAGFATHLLKWGVVGSSCGWMVFYAALLNGNEAHGWEILPALHTYAAQVLAKHVPTRFHSLLHFHCLDALQGDICHCNAIVIAGQCWEPWLLTAMYAKIKLECQVGTLLLDYNGALKRLMKQDQTGEMKTQRFFNLVFVKPLSVSWGTVDFHLWELCSDLTK